MTNTTLLQTTTGSLLELWTEEVAVQVSMSDA
jgi:hypothetical protein